MLEMDADSMKSLADRMCSRINLLSIASIKAKNTIGGLLDSYIVLQMSLGQLKAKHRNSLLLSALLFVRDTSPNVIFVDAMTLSWLYRNRRGDSSLNSS
jgi:hypothetical protein